MPARLGELHFDREASRVVVQPAVDPEARVDVVVVGKRLPGGAEGCSFVLVAGGIDDLGSVRRELGERLLVLPQEPDEEFWCAGVVLEILRRRRGDLVDDRQRAADMFLSGRLANRVDARAAA